MPQTRPGFTIEDSELFPDDGRRHELVDGEHVVTPAPTARHQRVSARLFVALHQAAVRADCGEVLYAPLDVVLSPTDVVQPDLLFVRRERAGIIGDRAEGAPDLVVEIVLPSSRHTDEMLKRRAYERFGVTELWIVDPELEVVRVYRRPGEGQVEGGVERQVEGRVERQGEGFARPRELAAERGDAVETPLLPGLRLDVARLFAS